ncbi:hypothetical protein SALB1_1275 [Salinisphaera sp. LB1]|nr:hypothetical protein SALB1_1275 [Salinisphaera sp. LB1]
MADAFRRLGGRRGLRRAPFGPAGAPRYHGAAIRRLDLITPCPRHVN